MNSTCTALIAEDELLLAESLRADLAALWPELQIVAMAAHGEAALEAALRLRPQVLFLDIRMPGMTGLEVAQALAEDWPDGDQNSTPFPLLVFVTAYDQYALKAFEQAALDYVLKPVQRERLAQTCSRLQTALRQRVAASSAPQRPADSGAMAAVAQLRQLLAAPGVPEALGLPAAAAQPLRLLQVSVGQTIHMVPVSEVIYFEAADKYVRVVTGDKEHLVRASLRELLPQLDAQQFWQVHRSVVVRTEAITRAVRDEAGRLSRHLRDRPERLAVSRMFAHLFKGL
ncbi:LytR/AlgR family response regulator transcription factor [Paucibacter sp. XJ19-41]|uniref:LytR/AlgR family response regulator transcription factor n=1 Tax=Paucibacter sp. XJ19-41 TaxID=2927824 RepID=UPI00234BC691|nr:LytTR family DNA-binding domain-containing protein [Paucibacter sp. XJ19-41]MDC6168579.1 LytTR family DNA-binding domain-containing protein [Paucibacter sp. XJ19-41]